MNTHEPLGLLSLNTRGLGESRKRNKLISWLQKFHNAKSKLIFLQETHTCDRNETQWKNDWTDFDVYCAHGDSGSRGVATIIPKSLDHEVVEIMRSTEGRYIALNIIINKSKFCLINCYAPNTNESKHQLKWLNEIQEIIIKNNDSNIIIGGDLNDVFIPELDRYKCKPNAPETDYVKAWKTVCNEADLVDIWRMLNPEKRCYTWRQGSSAARLKQSRLDYWLTSIHMTYDLNTVDISSSTGSDHSLIELNFYKNETAKRGPSFWRFNASLLKDKKYIEQINLSYKNAINKYNNMTDKGLMWDLIKMELRSATISYSKYKAKENRDNIKEAIVQINDLEKQLNEQPSDELLEEYNKGKKLIEDYNNEKAQGAQIRSKVNWTEHGEKNTKFFLNLEKRNYNIKCITKLIDEEEKEITEADEILKYEEKFYKNLYTEKKNLNSATKQKEIDDYFKDDTLPKINEDQKQSCESQLTLEEIGIALRNLKNGKSPGSDGFTTDFYKFFWPLIKDTVLQSLTFAYQNDALSIDQRRGIINLIPKKDKDPRLLKNWRPISLLNTDYKIITKVLANRIKKVLPSVINPDQVAYLKKRFIGQNIRTILDIMGYTRLMDKKGIIAFLDFEKAFDTIQWSVIYDALKLFNIGPVFIKWVHTIYNKSEACVTNNGYSSPFFQLERGVRQGCPLSAYLFIMVVEVLAHKIRTTNKIKGITIGQTEIKLVQMADDTTVFTEDTKSLEHILEILNKFEQYAGLKLNKLKTEALWIGKNINNVNTPLQIKWVKQIQSLGIFFSYNTDYVVQKNFMDRAKEFKRILDMWQQRDLSLIGKITVLKSLAFSKIIYQCGVLPIPPNFAEHITDLSYKFVWNNKPNKIKRKTLIAEYEKGGLKMLDIQSFLKAQKVMWVKRLISTEQGSWKALPMLFLKNWMGQDTFKTTMNCNTKPINFPDFYWQIIQNWFELKNLTEAITTPMEIRRQTLWLNKSITINKEELNWKVWQNKGINIIHDILNINGTFLTSQEIENKYNLKCNALSYNSLKDAIPATWRKIVKTMNISVNCISFDEQIHLKVGKIYKPISLVTNKEIYWTFVNKIQEEPIIINKLSQTLKIENTQWEKVFTISKVIKNTKIRTFQYKILFNLIPCNLYLQRINKSNTDKCTFCSKLDDISHYFWGCKQMQNFWNSFKRWWETIFESKLPEWNEKAIMIGILENTDKYQNLNACILLAKWYIYKTKLGQKDIFFYRFICDVKYYLVIEKTIALNQEKLKQYNTMWQTIEEQIT